MVQWFAEGGQVGILDGSNTTEERRQELVNRFKAYNITPLFIETICDNSAIIDANIRSVKVSSPDVSFFLCALSYSLSLALLTLSQHAICSYDPFWVPPFFFVYAMHVCLFGQLSHWMAVGGSHWHCCHQICRTNKQTKIILLPFDVWCSILNSVFSFAK